MDAYFSWLNALVNKCKSDFAMWPDLNWLNTYEAFDSLETRNLLLERFKDSTLFKGTKPFYKQISQGCRLCGEGQWSCLFITGKCNAGCFYCPVPQNRDEVPGTQGLDFNQPTDYADYVNHFKFKGVSFSGGEPLLTFERTLAYLKEVRKRCDSGLYVWAYTNGILADKNKMQLLADAGLNEIRFDIGATGFSLDKIAYAKGVVPNITIEIPAVPEEKERLISLLPQMIDSGVTNLNMHQLRLTPHNARHLSKRNYTYIPVERPIVLESELAALQIIDYAGKKGLDIGINYCSFFFKNRFQKAGYRRQVAQTLGISDSDITENGYIRHFTGNTIEYRTISLHKTRPEEIETEELQVDGKTYFVSRYIVFKELGLSAGYQKNICNLLAKNPDKIPSDPLLFHIWQMEYIEAGLREL